jgi:dihydrodipicolinate synthase/N-acetylneuraminate lyase
VAVGSTGESVLLSRAEVEQVFSAVREAAAPGRILVAGVGSESTPETISRCKAAADRGFDYALVKTPSFFKSALTPDALAEHYRRVADSSKLPVVLYSIPQFTGVSLEADLVARLAEHPNIVGSRGTAEGDDPGTIHSPQNFELNMTVAHDIGSGPHNMQAGIRVNNLIGNFSNFVTGGNSRYRNNGIGGYAANSGARSSFAFLTEPYVYPASPFPYENEPIGDPRTYVFYLSAKY